MSSDHQTADTAPHESASGRPGNGWHTFGIVVITVAVTLAAGYWYVTTYLFPEQFKPVVLNEADRQELDRKLRRLGATGSAKSESAQAEPYSEEGARREVYLTEKELNALLANNTDLASKLAIDLSENLASAVLLVDVDPDFPLLGGKTIKVTGGMEFRLVDGRPSAALKGISIWGIPLPNAWLGNLKNVDLLGEFGRSGGFWQAIREGVAEIEVEEGRLRIRLRE